MNRMLTTVLGVLVAAVVAICGLAIAEALGAGAPSPYERAQALDARVTAAIPKAQAVVTELQAFKAEADALEAATKPAPVEEPPKEEGHPQTTWAAASSTQVPLSDAAAAARVIHVAESRPDNVLFNQYVPTAAEISAFRSASASFSPLSKYVDGLDGLTNPSTDDLIQWGAAKWGVPVDWLRAEYVVESNSHQLDCGSSGHGCEITGGPAGKGVAGRGFGDCASGGNGPPAASGAPGCTPGVYQSVGITQVKEQSCCHIGTFPLAWKSTAFNIDYQASIVRYYFDGLCGWCTFAYKGREWESLSAWFSPGSYDAGAQEYVSKVKAVLAAHGWPGAA